MYGAARAELARQDGSHDHPQVVRDPPGDGLLSLRPNRQPSWPGAFHQEPSEVPRGTPRPTLL
jgi:hypothetical protein